MGCNFFFFTTLETRGKHKASVLSKVSKKKEQVKSISALPAAVPSELIEKSKQNQCEIRCKAKAFYHHVWFKSELL